DKSEQRLNSLCPVPLGGHVEEFDIKEGEDLIQVALHRELHEEAEVKSNIIATQFIGVIYLEDDNPVNHVHVGLAYVFDLDGEDVDIREDGLESLGFVDKQYLKENLEQLTYWSRLLIDS